MQVIQEKLAKLEKLKGSGTKSKPFKALVESKSSKDSKYEPPLRDVHRRSPDRLNVRRESGGQDKKKPTASSKSGSSKKDAQSSPFAERMRKSRFDTDASGKELPVKSPIQPLLSVQLPASAGRDGHNSKGDVDHRRVDVGRNQSASEQSSRQHMSSAKSKSAKAGDRKDTGFDEKRFYDDHDYRQKGAPAAKKSTVDLDFRHREYADNVSPPPPRGGGGDRKRGGEADVPYDSKRMRSSDVSSFNRGDGRRTAPVGERSPRHNQGQLNKELVGRTNKMLSNASVSRKCLQLKFQHFPKISKTFESFIV